MVPITDLSKCLSFIFCVFLGYFYLILTSFYYVMICSGYLPCLSRVWANLDLGGFSRSKYHVAAKYPADHGQSSLGTTGRATGFE